MSQQDETQIINGEADLLVESSGIEMTYHLNTVDQVNGEVCDSEPLSGTNTIGNGVDELLFTYDGATDCDGTCDDETFTDKASCEGAGGMWSGTPTQMLSINGGAQYEVEGAACATANSMDTIGWMIGLLGLLSIRRRQN